MHFPAIFALLAVLATSVTPRSVSGDVVTVYAYEDTEGRVLQSVALLRAGHNPCQRCEMTDNGLVNGLAHNLLMQFFTLDSPKIEVFETCFYDIVTTQYDHPRYVKHVLGRIYVFSTLFGFWAGGGGGLPRDVYTTCSCSFSPRATQKSKFSKLVFTELGLPCRGFTPPFRGQG